MRSCALFAACLLLVLPSVCRAEGQDFTPEVKQLFRVVTCLGDAPLPAGITPELLAPHCAAVSAMIAKYRRTYVEVAEPFLQTLQPKGLPDKVVYPFGGGDLLSALTTYPWAHEITTLSLEHPGDPRRLATITPKQLTQSLELLRHTASGLLLANDSKTENLMKGQRGELPGQLSFFMLALAVHGYEPVGLRFFNLEPDGTLHYLSVEEIAEQEKKSAKLLRSGWTSPDFSEAFSRAELTFLKKGADPKTELKTHRHFAENLDDAHFGADLPLQKFLEARGPIVAMTKAASYLLWRSNFSKIRDYLLDHMEFMTSDSTGIPPRFVKPKGFTQQTFGAFSESFLPGAPEHNTAFAKLWKEQPERKLAFRYGYLDGGHHFHLLITRKGTKD